MSRRHPGPSIHRDCENRWKHEAREALNVSTQPSVRSTSPNHCSREPATRATFPLALVRQPFLSPSLTSVSLSLSALATDDDSYTPIALASPISGKHVPYHKRPLWPSDAEQERTRCVTFCELGWNGIERFWSPKL